MSYVSSRNLMSTSSRVFNEHEISHLTDGFIRKEIKKLEMLTRILRLENEIFEKTLIEIDPKILPMIEQAMSYASRMKKNSTMSSTALSSKYSASRQLETVSLGSKTLSTASKGISGKVSGRSISANIGKKNFLQKINCVEKTELVIKVMRTFKELCDKTRKKSYKANAAIQSQLEEINLDWKDANEATDAFNIKVTVEGFDPLTKKIPAEVWIKYMKSWLRKNNIILEKLRLKTNSLKAESHKLNAIIENKKQFQDIVSVDFEKLEIDNLIAEKILDRLNSYLPDVQNIMGAANLDDTRHRKALYNVSQYLNRFQTRNDHFRSEAERFRSDSLAILDAQCVIEKNLEKVISLRKKYKVPSIMDYVEVKTELYGQRKNVYAIEEKTKFLNIGKTKLN